jgi:hypothetical protein
MGNRGCEERKKERKKENTQNVHYLELASLRGTMKRGRKNEVGRDI